MQGSTRGPRAAFQQPRSRFLPGSRNVLEQLKVTHGEETGTAWAALPGKLPRAARCGGMEPEECPCPAGSRTLGLLVRPGTRRYGLAPAERTEKLLCL